MAKIHAMRALALVGVPFRPQGRDCEGLDCVGLVLCTFDLGKDFARNDYRMRGDHFREIKAKLQFQFRRVSPRQARSGDLLLLAPGAGQLHLAVLTDNGFVHADAGLRRVVETPGKPRWPVLGTYRRRIRHKEL